MADKQLQYAVTFNTSQARTAAQQLGAVFRRELATLHLNILDPSSFNAAIQRTHQLQTEMQQVATQAQTAARNIQNIRTPTVSSGGSAGGGGIGGAIVGGLAGYLSIQGARQVAQQAIALDQLRGQSIATNQALVLLAGGGTQAFNAINQIREAAPGATSNLEAAQAAVTILGQKLPSVAVGLKDIAQFAAVVSRVSPVIRDPSDAIAQLTQFSNSSTYQRADQLAANQEAVKTRIEELRDLYPELSDAQLKAAATVQTVNEQYAPLIESLGDTVTGAQELTTAWADLREELAKGKAGEGADALLGGAAGFVQQTRVVLGSQDPQAQIQALESARDFRKRLEADVGPTVVQGLNFAGFFKGTEDEFNQGIEAVKKLNAGLEAGVPAASQYQEEISKIVSAIVYESDASDEQIARLRELSGLIEEQRSLGITVIDPNAVQSQTDTTEAAVSNLIDTFSQLDQAIATAGEFTPAQVPGIDEIQKALINLKIEIASTGSVTEEQAAKLAALEGVLQRAASGVDFLSTAEGRTAIATGGLNSALASTPGYLDAIAVAAGQAGAALQQALAIQGQVEGQLVSGLSGLISRGLITAETAGRILEQQQSVARTGANAIARGGGTPAEQQFAQAELQRQILAPVEAIQEAEQERQRAAREAESNAKRAQREIQSAWEKAADGVEDDFKKAADKLKDALDKVPGLTSPSDVTEQQMKLAEAGVPQNFADNYVRRLKDEVYNKVDRPEVSIEEARQGLIDAGLQVVGDAKADFELFAQAFADHSLFANPENLKFIDDAAVQANLDLQKKEEEGLKNIYDHFGASVEAIKNNLTQEDIDKLVQEKVQEILAKGGGGSAGGGYSVPVNIEPQLPAGGIFQPGAGVGVPLAGGIAAGDGAALGGVDISKFLSQQTGDFQAQGAAAAGMFDTGYSTYQHADLAGALSKAINDQLLTSLDQFTGQGASVAASHDLGYLQYERANLAGDLLADISNQLGAIQTSFVGQGGGVAGLIDQGAQAHDFAPAATAMINSLRSGFSTDENTNILMGIGGGLSQTILLGMLDEFGGPDWGETLFNAMMGSLLGAASDSLVGQ